MMWDDSSAPLVCICIPTYNAERTIQETLLSLVEQTYRNIIINVVDNASTDETVDLACSFGDPRIIVHTHQENVGGEGNFNRCIALSSGEFTAIFHADDLYEPLMVEEQVQFLMQHPTVGGVLTDAQVIDENGTLVDKIRIPKEVKLKTDVYDFEYLFKAVLKHSNFMVCPSAMVRTSVYKQTISNWRGDLFSTSADLDVWLRIAKHHQIGILPKPLMRYRRSRQQTSELIRRGTNRADFFTVMDYYLHEDHQVKEFVTKRDLASYASLERRNNVMRATNLFVSGNIRDAKALCGSFLSFSLFREAFKNKRGQLTLCLTGLLHFFIFFNMTVRGRQALNYFLNRVLR